MIIHFNPDVLIIGAGPTGLMAANQLNRFGINFIIVDSKDGPTEQSRAIAVTSRSLEIYEKKKQISPVAPLEDLVKIDFFHLITIYPL